MYMAFRYIRKTFVLQMFIAIILFAIFLSIKLPPFKGDILEIIVFGGAILGTGVGLMIRNGACTDGTEVLAILMNRRMGFTVGQIILVVNIFIFGLYGLIFQNWHIALQSLMTYIVAFKVMDIVIAGLDEMKSVIIITSKPQEISQIVMHKLGLGLTILPGIGGFSGKPQQLLFVIVERLDLAELKEIVLKEDPMAFMAIENLHEVAYGRQTPRVSHMRKRLKNKKFFSSSK